MPDLQTAFQRDPRGTVRRICLVISAPAECAASLDTVMILHFQREDKPGETLRHTAVTDGNYDKLHINLNIDIMAVFGSRSVSVALVAQGGRVICQPIKLCVFISFPNIKF